MSHFITNYACDGNHGGNRAKESSVKISDAVEFESEIGVGRGFDLPESAASKADSLQTEFVILSVQR